MPLYYFKMNRLRLLHIGDVHYPEKQHERLDDIKDASFPSEVAQRMVQTPLQQVLRAVANEIAQRPVSGYLISGDLTSKGNIPQYEACLDVLIDLLRLKEIPTDRIHAVPGNHDFDRASVDHTSLDVAKKFAPISEAWAARGIPVLSIQNVRETVVRCGTSSAALYSLNSCLGCGEKRHLPSEIADQLCHVLDGYAEKVGASDAFNLVGEKLDSPGFVQREIDDLCNHVHRLNPGVVPVVLSHHNLLPQAVLRLEIYTEVMNAGRVRSLFCDFKKTVLYCHGHIHDYPVEVIETPDNNLARVVAIAAPELCRGFNIIHLEYGEKGTPLGCRIHRFKYNLRNGSVLPEEVRVSLTRLSYQRAIGVGPSGLKAVLAKLGNKEVRFQDAFDKMKWTSSETQRCHFADVLGEAEWLGLIEIEHRQNEPDHWWIKKVAR
jgi:hypothetical protein